ncbi:MAG: mannose-1-phosphate guanylyltransferase/mannose-6-phosphate isomerase [Thermodesulfobacteriota bacterium]
MITPVILCGGSGTRLWPLSREFYPKQLLALTAEHTLLQQTARRLAKEEGILPPLVICNEEHRFLVAEQLRQCEVKPAAIILEPMGRNTAPAAALAALHAAASDPDALLLILPADHLIRDIDRFSAAVQRGIPLAQDDQLVTFGIVPLGAETGYGYIQRGEELTDCPGCFTISRFVEKPDEATAQGYVDSGDFFWNSGMFLIKASAFLQELGDHNREMANQCQAAFANSSPDLDFLRVDTEHFQACPSDSIDYAVMEKTKAGVVIPVDPGWNDIGSWAALWEVGDQDADGNVVHGDVVRHDSHNSYLHSSNRLIAAVGVEDMVVVETADAVLVSPKERVQEVKEIVTLLRQQERPEANLHRRVFRPWGCYEGIMNGERFQVKIITVNPGATLSLQMHHHRAEHWIVVRGTARITKGDKVCVLTENESTYIPLGTSHRLENPGVIPLELIEVQSGSYLGEDDIVRFEDQYGRTAASDT